MAELIPIRAIRYACEPGGDVSTRIAPPYDVLDEGPKRELLARDGDNIVAIDLPVTPPKTVGPDSAYAAAGDLLRRRLAEGVLIRDGEPAIYAYEQLYALDGKTCRRRGMLTGVRVEPFGRRGGGIHRHEMTIRSGTDDRLKLMEATGAQMSPVFSVFPDPAGDVRELLAAVFDAAEPDFRGTTAHDGVDHRVWIVTDTAIIDALRAALADRDVFIADGHHRYVTAMNYREAHPDAPAAEACLMVLVPIEDPGLAVLPTHRVLCGLDGVNMTRLVEAIEADGRLAIAPAEGVRSDLARLEAALPSAGRHAFGVYDPATGSCHIVSSRTDDPLADVTPDRPAAWRTLDVAIVHELFVDRIVKPTFDASNATYLYPHETRAVRELAGAGPGRLGIIVQPTALRDVCDVALAGDVMPAKSTFFYPKMATGLVINPLTDPD